MSAFLGYLPLIWLDIIPETWSCCYLEKIRTHGRIGLDLRLQNKICSYSCCCRNVCLWARLTIICSPAAWVSTFSFPVSVLGLRVHACGFNWNLNFPLLKLVLPSISSLKKKNKRNEVVFQISYIFCRSLQHPLSYVLLLPICEHKVCNFLQVIESKLLYQYFQTLGSFGIIDCAEDIQ